LRRLEKIVVMHGCPTANFGVLVDMDSEASGNEHFLDLPMSEYAKESVILTEYDLTIIFLWASVDLS
jgi:hypothetical protein